MLTSRREPAVHTSFPVRFELAAELVAFGAKCLFHIADEFATDALDGENAVFIVFITKPVEHIGDYFYPIVFQDIGVACGEIKFANWQIEWSTFRILLILFGADFITLLQALHELINTTFSVDNPLFAGVERVTVGTDLNR